MSTIESIQHTIQTELQQLNDCIKSQLGASNPMMDTVVSTYLRTKGKQIRPIIVILTAKMMGSVSSQTISAAAAVELLHNASLIHDDVVDNAQMRRNAPTINCIWDNHIAVLVGDFFVSSAMQQAIATGDIRIIDALCYLGKLLSLGELDQIYNARYHLLTEDAYFRIIEYKTASLFIACAKMGCYTANADPESIKSMEEFARLMGLCFQMRDDVLDYYASEKVGKPTGNDLREGKITLPLLYALSREDAPNHQAMKELAQQEQLDDEQIQRLMDYARDNGGIEYTFQRMGQLRDRGIQILSQFPQNESTDALASIFDSIVTPER